MTAEDVLLDELGNYYNGDVLPHPMDLLGDDDADHSAERVVRWHRAQALDVAQLLRRLAADPHDGLLVTIERQTMMGWNGDPDEWRIFERLVTRMAESIERLLAESSDERSDAPA